MTARETLAEEIRSGQSIELLKELHILTRDGKLNQDSRRKLKQVYHLYHFIEPLLDDVLHKRSTVTLVDHGAGKSYLGFILYDLFFKQQTCACRVIGVEPRTELVEKSSTLADRLGFHGMSFLNASVVQAAQSEAMPQEIDVVTALHACDTATDDAIRFGLERQVSHMVLVPCCQAEVATALRAHKSQMLSRSALAELWRHPVHTREFGSHITNVLRCLQLQAHGYQIAVTELVGWEHSMKNELIVASRNDQPNGAAARRLGELIEMLGITELASRFFIPD